MTRNQIHQHILDRGTEDIDITIDVVYYWWWVFNRALFEGKMKAPDRVEFFHKDAEVLGWYEHNIDATKYKHVIGLNWSILEAERQLFLNVLAHEMVHMCQSVYEPDQDAVHGKYFYSFRPVFADAGLSLASTYKTFD